MQNRRRFLYVLGSAALVLGAGVPACGSNSTQTGEPSGLIPAGLAKDVPMNSLTPVGDQAVVLGRDAGGLYAMTTICTHAGCNMRDSGQISPTGLQCGCHGSVFDANGNVQNGPASSPLNHLAVTVGSDGSITINADQIVPEGQRTPVPA